MRIGPIELGPRPLLLAPMEDVSDPPFRLLCKRYGADLLYTEFISSGGLAYGAESSIQKMEFYEEERPLAIQIFGGEEAQVREAARLVDAQGPDLIDINFGCPVKKVVCHDGGAGILRNLPKMQALTAAVIEEATRPVTVKTRLGWDDASIQILDVARMLEETGVAALAVHARTRSQMYNGGARWDWLRRLKDEGGLSIPLIGNGDATTPEKVEEMFEATGVDAVMIGRGAIGNPWIFRDTKAFLETGEVPPPPSWEERVAVVAEHVTLKCAWLGERKGVLEMRRMYGGYFKGHAHASQLRQRLVQAPTQAEVLDLLLNTREGAPDVQVHVPVTVRPAVLPPKARLPRPATKAA
ncbi:MAG TPA: tRNA dihydrouridine synthase DusB [Rubricoccaceae bacterium]|nr:tRNA dihydrouridine synthase DusB [Rubricoccaceae bacterium]